MKSINLSRISRCTLGAVRSAKECYEDSLRLGAKKRSATRPEDLMTVRLLCLITPGRSGTKSLVRWCSGNTSMYCKHSPTPWLASIGYLYHQNEVSPDVAAYAYYASRERYLLSAYEHEKVFFDGDCKNLPVVDQIARLLPNSRFLHIVRNPVSFVISGLSRGYYKTKAPQLWGHLQKADDGCDASFDVQVEKIAWFWNEANKIAEDMKTRYGDERVTSIVSEDMFSSVTSVTNALRHLGLEDVIGRSGSKLLGRSNRQRNRVTLNEREGEIVRTVVGDVCSTKRLYFNKA